MLSLSSIVHVQLCKSSANSTCHPSSCLLGVLATFLAISSYSCFETSEMSAIIVFTTKTTQARPQVFSVDGALTFKKAAHVTSSVH